MTNGAQEQCFALILKCRYTVTIKIMNILNLGLDTWKCLKICRQKNIRTQVQSKATETAWSETSPADSTYIVEWH